MRISEFDGSGGRIELYSALVHSVLTMSPVVLQSLASLSECKGVFSLSYEVLFRYRLMFFDILIINHQMGEFQEKTSDFGCRKVQFFLKVDCFCVLKAVFVVFLGV